MTSPSNFSLKQAKLLSSALRMKIVSVLVDEPKTSRQVATELNQSPGNVHYHIKRLHEGGLLELVEEKKVRGLTEKYYKSTSKWFNTDHDGTIDHVLSDSFEAKQSTALSIRLHLSPEQRTELEEGFRDFLEGWVKKADIDEANQEFSIGVKVVSTEPKEKP
ncbi:helix-turn-helix transcriptional regulator [Paenalkalicoccus suaedae]|uniref:Helix-turn-helix transcriptional regulator n=1 Tax=Paenalkalicoccus suaedae TaxID=2592382 RepID=A0A859FJQ4_9BACI|nr:helix-turn-helix domain-containing protein [Paenalkalicoccus suaedae]QKS73028.1 helix-turn-helix transcriptional regulator [Paenalkalicoccus suaedae]